MKAILLAAGASTRTYPLTLTRPKPILPLLNGTILDYTLTLLRDMGKIDEVILVVNYKKEMIIEHFGDSYRGMKLTYVDQKEPLGTGHAVLCAEHVLDDSDESFIVLNGDDLYSREDISHLIKSHPRILVSEVQNPKLYGVFESKLVDGKMIAVGLEEKPLYPKSNLANIGCYHFGKDFFKYLKKIKQSPRGEYEITDAIKRYIDWHDLELLKVKEYWFPIGYPWDILSANEFLASRTDSHPRPIISESAVLKKNSEVTGYSIIGKNVKIGNDTKVSNSIIMDGAVLGSDCIIKDSIVGEGAKIEKNFNTISEHETKITSAVRDGYIDVSRKKFGCIIGDYAKISKKITIYPGVKIWPEKYIYNVVELKEDVH